MSKNINPREKAEKRQKIKDIIFKVIHGISYVCTGLFVAVCIVACATQNKSKTSADTSSVVVERIESPKYKIDTSESVSESLVSYPIYNDVNYEITFSAYQLNNYIFENIYNAIDLEGLGLSDCVTQIVFSNENLYNTSAPAYDYGAWSLKLENSLELVSFVYNVDDFEAVAVPEYNKQNYTFANYEDNDGDVIYYNFIDEIVFSCESEYYALLKNAIQLDIQANEETIDVGIFEGLTTSITSFITTLNTGLAAIIGIFWNDGLTPLGILSTLVVGVALVYFIFRLVIGLIRLRG